MLTRRNTRTFDRSIAFLAAAAAGSIACAQVPTVTTLNVVDGAPIQEVNIAFGQYFGQNFVVDPTLTIELNDALGNNPTFSILDLNGATVNVQNGGTIFAQGFTFGNDFRASEVRNATINMFAGGRLDANLAIASGTVLTMFGGVFDTDEDEDSRVNDNGRIRMEGGLIEVGFFTSSGSVLEIVGGELGNEFIAGDGSQVFISGGIIGEDVGFFSGSTTQVTVTSATLNGASFFLLPGQPRIITERGGETLLMTLADGTVWDFTLNGSGAGAQDYVGPAVPQTDPFPLDKAVFTLLASTGSGSVDFNGVDGVDSDDISDIIVAIDDPSDPRDGDLDDKIGENMLDLIASLVAFDAEASS